MRVNTYAGLTIPLIASATATFLFRQFYLTIPDELVDAAKIDGSGPLRFLWSILLPNSGANIAALFVVMFIYGWNQYLWPLMVTSSEKMQVVVGIASTVPTGTQPPEWNLVMAAAMMALAASAGGDPDATLVCPWIDRDGEMRRKSPVSKGTYPNPLCGLEVS
jgi:sn-glycerol 3-phosphate transport system permease protein